MERTIRSNSRTDVDRLVMSFDEKNIFTWTTSQIINDER